MYLLLQPFISLHQYKNYQYKCKISSSFSIYQVKVFKVEITTIKNSKFKINVYQKNLQHEYAYEYVILFFHMNSKAFLRYTYLCLNLNLSKVVSPFLVQDVGIPMLF